MVVKYPTGGEGTWKSLFTIVPRVIFQCEGSVVPNILPQIILFSSLGVVANRPGCNIIQRYGFATFGEHSNIDLAMAMQTIGILLSFLMVFKTQTAYGQFWQAAQSVDGLLTSTRHLARLTVSSFSWTDDVRLKARVRRTMRLLAAYYFVVVEYFQSTGPDATKDKFVVKSLRANINQLTGPEEFDVLYDPAPQCDRFSSGNENQKRCFRSPASRNRDLSAAEYISDAWLRSRGVVGKDAQKWRAEFVEQRCNTVSHANPMTIIFWIQTVVRRLCVDSRAAQGASLPWRIDAPLECKFYDALTAMETHFCSMEQVDKLAFPFPYAQMVHIVLYTWMLLLPFVLQPKAEAMTPFITCIISIGFFGLDAVAEILQSPFGNDPNDIDLTEHGSGLVEDLQQMFDQHDMEFASVFDDANEFDLTQLELSYKRLGKKAQKDARKSERKRRELQANYSMLRTSGNSNRRDLGKDRPGWSALP